MRLVIVSNRLPFTVSMKEGALQFERSSGGLTTGLLSYLERASNRPNGEALEYLWIGWPGINVEPDRQAEVVEYSGREFKSAPVFLSEESMERFYHGFCNKTIWPLFHYFTSLARYEEEYWQEYKKVNEIFAEAVLQELRPNDILWVQDYHLMLVPALIRQRYPDLPIGFFLHIPFPSWEVFRLLPRAWRSELVDGLLGSSVVGFHTHDYTRDFLTSVLRTVGHEHQLGVLNVRDRMVKVDTFPMGIDFERFAETARLPQTQTHAMQVRERCAGQKVIFSVDRLDYTKGLINRLRGYDLFLRRHPEWHGKVVFIISVAPSRIGVESYRAMRQELEQTVGRIVGTHGNVNWTPLIYQYRNLGFDEIVAMYLGCDVALITPLRDGMNLVAKEFIASRSDQSGVLILSEMAGAAKEMGEALVINPFHGDDFATAIEQALTMPAAEQVRRNQLLQDRLRRYDVNRWAEDFVHKLVSSQQRDTVRRARWFNSKAQTMLSQHYRQAASRALLLDYDGTLVGFASTPKQASPDGELVELLEGLSTDPNNHVAIVSGRGHTDLQEWFGHLNITLIAEHGLWLRPSGGAWRLLRSVSNSWKSRVRPILQMYVDRLPGALLEEKQFSLAWHFRSADPEQAPFRAKELLDDLADYTRNVDVQVLEGNKVIEIRNTAVSKGTGVLEWLGRPLPEFVLAVGDDWTDEDLFRSLPPTAFSLRVGMAKTAARFHITGHAAVRRMLRDLVEFSGAQRSMLGADRLSADLTGMLRA